MTSTSLHKFTLSSKWVRKIISLLLIPAIGLQTVSAMATCQSNCVANYNTDSLLAAQEAACNELPGRCWDKCDNFCATDQEVLDTNRLLTECKRNTEKGPKECVREIVHGKACERIYGGNSKKIERCKANNEDFSQLDASGVAKFHDLFGWGNSTEAKRFFKSPTFLIHGSFVFFNFVTYIILRLLKDTCSHTSIITMFVTSLLAMVGEIGTFYYMKDELGSMRKKLSVDYNRRNFKDIQIQAFDTLIKEQGIRYTIESIRTGIYAVVSVGYLAASIFAVKETIGATNAPCNPTPPDDKVIVASSSIPKGVATISGAGTPPTPPKGFDGYFAFAFTRAILSGLMFGLSVTMTTFIGLATKKTLDNKKDLEALRDRYLNNQHGANCPSRGDQTIPECYCYDESGEKDPDKFNSKICQHYWQAQTLASAPKDNYDYLGAEQENPLGVLGCLDIKNEYDATCKCRKYKDNKGNNACYKSLMTGPLVSFSSASWMNNFDGTSTSLLNGNLRFGNALPTQNMQLASRIHPLLKNEIKEANVQLHKNGQQTFPVTDSEFDEHAQNLLKSVPKELAEAINQNSNISANSLLADTKASPLSEAMKNVLKDLKRSSSSSLDGSLFYAGGKGGKRQSKKEQGLQFDPFANGGDGERMGSGKIEDLPSGEKNYRLGDRNIHAGQGPSIWEILTLRYQKSAYDKLFPEAE